MKGLGFKRSSSYLSTIRGRIMLESGHNEGSSLGAARRGGHLQQCDAGLEALGSCHRGLLQLPVLAQPELRPAREVPRIRHSRRNVIEVLELVPPHILQPKSAFLTGTGLP